jgi:hypothetical protein
MADAIVTCSVVPSGVAGSIATLVTDLLAESLDTVTADPGADLVVSAEVTHSVAADADGTTSLAAIETAVTNVGDCEILEGSTKIESDPILSAPANVALDVSDADTEDIVYTFTLCQDARLVSIALASTDLAGVSIPFSVVHGDPQGHESQKSGEKRFVVRVGPSPAGGTVGSPHDLTVTITDSNGRTDADTVAVTVAA